MVATPIGNLDDMTFRAVDVLARADHIACEDTRVTGKLLKHFGIDTPTFIYNDHNGARVRPRVLDDLRNGKAVAMVSDAGTPLISDPGYKLVKACADEAIKVVPVPGASALLAGLTVGGLPTDRVLFVGFLPSKKKARQTALSELVSINATLVFYEAGPRLVASLNDMVLQLGPRPAAVARELTKMYEEVRRDSLDQLARDYAMAQAPKGELVVVVGPPTKLSGGDTIDIDHALQTALKTMSVRDAAADVAEQTGRPRRDLYGRALELKRGRAGEQ